MEKKEKNKVPQRPDPMSKDWSIPDADSRIMYLFEIWLKEKSEETGQEIPDVLAEVIEFDILLKDWGREKLQEKNMEYSNQQKRLRKAYIEYCDQNEIDEGPNF